MEFGRCFISFVILFAGALASAEDISTAKQSLLMARYAERQGQWSQAFQLYEKAAESPETFPEAMAGLAHIHILEGRLDAAEKAIQKVLKGVNPFHVETRTAQAELFHARGRLDEALQEIQSVLALRRAYLPAIEVQGLVYFDQRKFEPAIDSFNKVLKDNPSLKYLRAKRGRAYLEMGRAKDALEDLAFLTRETPVLSENWVFYAQALAETGQAGGAQKALLRARESNIEDLGLRLRMGEVYEKLGMTTEAVELYQKILLADSRQTTASGRLLKIYLSQKEFKKAEDEYHRLLEVPATQDAAAQGLVNLWDSEERGDKVAAFARSYHRKNPEKGWVTLRLARSLVQIRDFLEAEKVLDLHLSKSPDSWEAVQMCADLKFQRGERAKALAMVEAFERRQAQHLESKKWLVRALGQMGRTEQARSKEIEVQKLSLSGDRSPSREGQK